MTTTTKMELVDIGKLIPYVNNTRTHSPEQITKLRSSLREFGFVNPVLVDKEYNVIAGHARIAAAKEEGLSKVPCVFVEHLTDPQKKAYIIADNTQIRKWLKSPYSDSAEYKMWGNGICVNCGAFVLSAIVYYDSMAQK